MEITKNQRALFMEKFSLKADELKKLTKLIILFEEIDKSATYPLQLEDYHDLVEISRNIKDILKNNLQ